MGTPGDQPSTTIHHLTPEIIDQPTDQDRPNLTSPSPHPQTQPRPPSTNMPNVLSILTSNIPTLGPDIDITALLRPPRIEDLDDVKPITSLTGIEPSITTLDDVKPTISDLAASLIDLEDVKPTISDLAPSLTEIEPSIGGLEDDARLRLTGDVQMAGPSGVQMRLAETTGGNGKRGNGAARKVLGGYQCGHCQKVFPNSSKLLKHQQTLHSASLSSNAPFKCDNCKKTFSSKFKLVRHSLIHSDRRPFSCTVCNRTFHRKDHLKNHCKVHDHSKELYVCGKLDCKKEYTSHLSYKKHLALHSAEEGNLNCQLCHKGFRTKDEVLMHLKVHAGSRPVKNPDEKKYRCDLCDRKFFTRKDVRRHEVVHTGMRDFLCQFCPERFGRKDHLIRHIKKLHYQQQQQQLQTTSTTPIIDQQQEQLAGPSTSSSSIAAIKLERLDDVQTPESLDMAEFYDTTSMNFLFDSTVTAAASLVPVRRGSAYIDTGENTEVEEEEGRGVETADGFRGIIGDSVEEDFKHEPLEPLADLGSDVLEDITCCSTATGAPELSGDATAATTVDSDFIQLLQQTVGSTGKLPAFDQIFQQQSTSSQQQQMQKPPD